MYGLSKLKQMYDQIAECNKEMIKTINNQLKTNVIDVRDIMGKFAIDTIGMCSYGLTLNTLNDDNSKFWKYIIAIFTPSFMHFIRELCLMTSAKILKIVRIPNYPKEATEFFRNAFRDTITYRENSNIVRNDLVSYLIKMRRDLVLNEHLAPDGKINKSTI